jgi:hypothetical protein
LNPTTSASKVEIPKEKLHQEKAWNSISERKDNASRRRKGKGIDCYNIMNDENVAYAIQKQKDMNETSPLEDLVEQKEELIPQLNENR